MIKQLAHPVLLKMFSVNVLVSQGLRFEGRIAVHARLGTDTNMFGLYMIKNLRTVSNLENSFRQMPQKGLPESALT